MTTQTLPSWIIIYDRCPCGGTFKPPFEQPVKLNKWLLTIAECKECGSTHTVGAEATPQQEGK